MVAAAGAYGWAVNDQGLATAGAYGKRKGTPAAPQTARFQLACQWFSRHPPPGRPDFTNSDPAFR